jgi:predicted MFS family arabinose efflux permease
MGAFAAADPSGRLVVWAQSAITIGLMLGPPAAAAIIDASSTTTMIWLSVLITLLALVFMLPALSRGARTVSAGDAG